MFPGVNVFAGTHYEDNRLLYSNNWNTIGAGVSLELLDLPARYVAYRGQKKAIEMAKAQRLMTTVGIITQTHIALLDYAIKVDRFRLLDETYALANNLFKMAQEKNQIGRLPELAVTQRNLEEMAAKLRRDESVVDLLVAHKRLCVTIGIDPLECESGLLAAKSAGTTETYGYTETTGMKKWKCLECGYIHTGPEPPEICPICGVGKEGFVEITGQSDIAAPAGTIEATDLASWGESPPLMTGDELSRSDVPPGYASPASDRFLWKVQLGSFVTAGGPSKRIEEIQTLAMRMLDNRDTVVTTTRVNGQLFNRVRVLGLTEDQARKLAQELEGKGIDSWIVAPHSVHW